MSTFQKILEARRKADESNPALPKGDGWELLESGLTIALCGDGVIRVSRERICEIAAADGMRRLPGLAEATADYVVAPAIDLLNTWMRESGLYDKQCKDANDMQRAIDDLWANLSVKIHKPEESADALYKACVEWKNRTYEEYSNDNLITAIDAETARRKSTLPA